MFITFSINLTLVAMAVIIHYETLYLMSKVMPKLAVKHRYRLVAGMFVAMFAHIVEIWLFAFAYYFLIRYTSLGSLVVFNSGETVHKLADCIYYSFITYTTLGFGDVIPTGSLRFLTGMESLIGLLLITWTASFMYIKMQKYWND